MLLSGYPGTNPQTTMTEPTLATPETHQIYHIFLASPGDMNEERQIVRDFFDGYNRNIANRQNIELKVIDWEHFSNIGVGRTQALITQQTLDEFRNSLVLVVGLLGQRFRTRPPIFTNRGRKKSLQRPSGFVKNRVTGRRSNGFFVKNGETRPAR
jgi:hypothetical protein